MHICPLHSGPVTTDSAEHSASRHWGNRQTLAAIVVAAVIGGIGGAAVYAATSSSHAMPGVMRGQMHGPRTAPPVPTPAGPAGVLHSEYVVSDGHGGFDTKMTQTGVVDEVTLSQIVVRSDDGFTQIYVFPSAAVVPDKSVAAKDTVTVDATRTGATVTLDRIGEGQPPAH
jgi:hypothetical protein